MKHIISKNYEAMSRQAAIIIAAQILHNKKSILGLATGSTPIGTYQELVKMYDNGLIDFQEVTSFNLDEYFGVPVTDENSYRYFMNHNLFDHVNIKKESTFVPDGTGNDPAAEGARYEKMIAEAGGVDLQILGLGHNGHIGFNEPDDYFPAETHLVSLTESTIEANARFYNSREEVPKSAITMGIGTIMKAKKILLLVGGSDKAEILKKVMYGPITPQVPASALQLHQDVTVLQVV